MSHTQGLQVTLDEAGRTPASPKKLQENRVSKKVFKMSIFNILRHLKDRMAFIKCSEK